MNINKIHLPKGMIIHDALSYMAKADVSIVHHETDVYLCYKESHECLRVWKSGAAMILKEDLNE